MINEKPSGIPQRHQGLRSNTTSFFTKKFVERWFSTFIWLEKGSDEEGRTVMFCRWCRAINANNTFTAGCRDLQKSALTRHELIKDHKRATSLKGTPSKNAVKFRESKPVIESTKLLSGLIRNVYFLDMEGISLSKLDRLIKLQIMNGAKRFEGFRKTHRYSLSAMQDSIQKTIRQRNSVLFANTPVFGLILNEERNASGKSMLVISVRGVKHGKAFTTMIDHIPLSDSSSGGLFHNLCTSLEANCIDLRRIVGIASDGKDIVLNPSDGFVSKFKEVWSPFLLQTHSIFLVAPIDFNDGGIIYSLQQAIKALFYYFTTSRVSTIDFHEEFDSEELLQISSTNTWKCQLFIKGVSFLHSHWSSFVLALREHCRHRKVFFIDHLLSSLLSFRLLAAVHSVLDLLPLVERIKTAFQASDFSLTMTRPRVVALKERLVDLISNSGPNESKFVNEICVANRFRGEVLREVTKGESEAHEKARHALIHSMIENISLRFPSTDLDVIWAIGCIFDVSRYPSNIRELDRYGNEALEIIINRFGHSLKDNDAVVDSAELKQSFGEFKHILASDTCSNFSEACTVTIVNLAAEFPNFARLANIAVVLPVYGSRNEGEMSSEEIGLFIPPRPELVDAETLIHAACEDYLWSDAAELRNMMKT